MKTEYPGVDWLLDCEPRLVQLEALARSYTGRGYRNSKDEEICEFLLPHAGGPAKGWGHMMEMRLGKTPTLLNEFMLFKRDHGINKAVVWSPNKYKNTWALEAEKFGVDVPVLVFDSTKKSKFNQFMRDNPSSGVVFANYEAAQFPENMLLFEQFVDDRTYMGADESVLIKNREAIATKNISTLAKNAALTRPMTGKPSPQGVQDLYSQLRFARKLEGWDFYQFRNSFALMGGHKKKQVVGVKNVERLQRILHKSCFIAKRKDWGTHYDSDYEMVECELSSRQHKAYSEMEKEFIAWLNNGEMVSVEQVITKHMKLQQISSGFIIDEFKEVHELISFEQTPKFKELMDRLENYVNGKTIILANYTRTLEHLYSALKRYNPALICGGQGMKAKGLNVDDEKQKFNNDNSCTVMIGQLKAIKYGHTLMGSVDVPCHTMVFFENSYSLDDRSQTEQRPQGEGQSRGIHIMDFVSSPVERKIIGALQRKEHVSETILQHYKTQ